MIVSRAGSVQCFHDKWRTITFGDDMDTAVRQCVDCFDTFGFGEKTNRCTSYDARYFDAYLKACILDYQGLLFDPSVKIEQPVVDKPNSPP